MLVCCVFCPVLPDAHTHMVNAHHTPMDEHSYAVTDTDIAEDPYVAVHYSL